MNKNYAAWASRWRVPLGFVLGAAYAILAQPAKTFLLSGGAVALAGVLLRAWSAGYLAKNERLVTGGPYSCTRNPLYLGSSLIGLGCAVAGRTWVMGIAFAIFLAMVYWPVMKREAEFLRKEFPEAYEPYAKQVSLFFPTVSRYHTQNDRFEWKRYLKNHEYEAALGYGAAMLLLALKMWLR